MGALCVLAILWVVNEIFNRKLMNMDAMVDRRTPRVLQYGVIQMILFVMGIMMAVAVVKETGAFNALTEYLGVDEQNPSVWAHGVVAGVISTVLDNFATAINFFSLPDLPLQNELLEGMTDYSCNGLYWQVIAYCVMAGGNVLGIGTVSGLALMKWSGCALLGSSVMLVGRLFWVALLDLPSSGSHTILFRELRVC